MNDLLSQIQDKLALAELKITPQRIAVLEAVLCLHNHPTADEVIEYIRKEHPHIAVGTVYKVLETLVEKQIIKKVKTDKDVMRYDGVLTQHHHIYFSDSEEIMDFTDTALDELLSSYFKKRKIPNLNIEEIKLQINGKHINK